MKKKTTIYLADLTNSHFGYSPATVPLAIGYLKAYAVSQCPGAADIRLFRTFESLIREIERLEPDILGCSWYGWNFMLTVNALAYIKWRFPRIITVVGGANAPEQAADCLRDFKDYPAIDVIIPNEGELPFVNLINGFLRGGRDGVFEAPIDGVFYPTPARDAVVGGNAIPSVKDINIFPSPYLEGHLDAFLDGEWMPMMQTARGCPYNCAFCVSAKLSWSRVRAFDVERIQAEFHYLSKKAKNKALRLTDENFGILPRDLEIARFISDNRKKTGYPSALRMYTDKHINERIKAITTLLQDLIPMNISTQTMTESVLHNIHRKNISFEHIRDSVNWGHNHGMNVTTEVIFGLPGETYASFMETINKLVELRFDSVAIGTLLMLKETELARPASIEKYGYKMLYSVAERGYTKVGDFESVEVDYWVVENNLFSFDEYIKINLFILIYSFFMFFGYIKEVVYLWENRGLKLASVISELIDNPARYPFFAKQLERLKKCLLDNLHETREDVRTAFIRRYVEEGEYVGYMNHYILSYILMGEMIHPSNRETMLDEIVEASVALYDAAKGAHRDEFLGEMRFAKDLVKTVIIPYWETPAETVALSSPYDLIAWRNQDYKGALSRFALPRARIYQYKINSHDQYTDFIRENAQKPFFQQSEFFFRTLRSNNVRRFIVSDDADMPTGGSKGR